MASRNEIELIFKVLNLGKKEMAALEKQLGKIEKTGKKTSKGLALLGKAVAAIGFAAAAKQAATFVFEATKLAARVETLGVVTETLGRNAGYTALQITQLERAIQKKGITTQASRQALAKMMQAELDLADATDLARLAQDAAVIAGTNSSEAFQRLVNVISTGNVRMARTMGLQVNFNAGYEKMAEQLGKTTDELTEQEKAQSRANSVLAEGVQIAGTYEAAMESVGKQLESTARFWEEFRVEVGKANVGLLGFVNLAAQDWLEFQTERLIFLRLNEEALEAGIITQEKWAEGQLTAGGATLEYSEAIEKLTEGIDSYNLAEEKAIDLSAISLKAELKLIRAYSAAPAHIDEITVALSKFTKEAIGARVWQAMWEEFSVDGFITDEEKEKLLEAGDVLGITLPEDINSSIFSFNEFGGAAEVNFEIALDYLNTLTSKTWIVKTAFQSSGGMPTVPAPPRPIIRPGRPTRRAAGGPLSSVSLVGEEGFELIINGVVVPHEQSKRLMRLGLAPDEGFIRGGRPFGFRGRHEQIIHPPGTGSAWHSTTPDLSYLSKQTSVPTGATAGASGNAQVVAATQASVAIASVVAQGNAVAEGQNDTIIDILSSLATAEDMELAMTTALELSQL